MAQLITKLHHNQALKADFLAIQESIKYTPVTESLLHDLRNRYSRLFMQYRIKVEFRIAHSVDNTLVFVPVNLIDDLIINGILNS